MTNILTFDIEDWFHILEYERSNDITSWSQFEERIDIGLDFILESLRHREVTATFFILGWIAERYPDKVKKIYDSGHELANHSYSHQLVYEQTPREFMFDIERATTEIYRATNIVTTIFRAPGFSITDNCHWAFSALHKLGFNIDASIFLASRAHGGFKKTSSFRGPFTLDLGGHKTLMEFPVVASNLFNARIPFTGGGYFRLYPKSIQQLLSYGLGDYSMWYFHPRDFDPLQPKLPGLSKTREFRTYVGLQSSKQKFHALLEQNSFISIGQAKEKFDQISLPAYTLNCRDDII